tara:strand:- start:155105 stop:155713 length:609 start_codon:yes stop_codon:yes gene_type:complete
MNIKQFFRTGLGLALVAMVSVQAVAFMNTIESVDPAEPATDYVALIDSIAEQLKSDQVDCDAMLEKIDEALGQIDESLDAGVADEESLLAARDALVSMRLELPCRSDELAVMQMAVGDAAMGGSVLDSGFAGGGCVDCGTGMVTSGGGGAVSSGGGGAVGGGGAAAGSGGGLRRLLLLGGLTGGIIAASSSDDDGPAPETSL